MSRTSLSVRWLLFAVLLTALFFGTMGQSLARVEAAPHAQATSCWGSTITQWTFDNTTNPSFGYGIFSAGAGINGPTYVSSGINNPPAVSYNDWDATTFDPSSNEYLDFSINISGRNSIELSFTSNRSDSGPIEFQLQYSVDGGAFVTFGASRSITTTELNYVYDFGSIGAFNTATSVDIRLFAYNASSTSSGSWRLDNVTFSGNCINPGDTPTSTVSATASPVRSVIINEVAWMGTLASSNHEWIELYNPGATTISLSGWRLYTADGTGPDITIPVGYSIAAGGYFLLENGSVFTGANAPSNYYPYNDSYLSDSGEALILKDSSGTTIDTANGNGGPWPAGTLTTAPNHGTMERMGTSADTDYIWTTNSVSWNNVQDAAGNVVHGTPGGPNWGYSVTNTPTALPTSTATASRTNTPTLTFTPTLTHTPTITSTQVPKKTVVITEVAWMGTLANSSDEWIELYNPSTTETVDITGWQIRSFPYINSSPKIIPFDSCPINTVDERCKIGPGEYFLMERREEAVSDIDADFIYAWSLLSNSGEMMLLCDPHSISAGLCTPTTPDLNVNVIDVVNNFEHGHGTPTPSPSTANPWPAGYGSPYYYSMERKNLISNDDTNWYSHVSGVTPRWGKDANGNNINGTPKHPNWSFEVTATPRPTVTPTRTRTPLAMPGPVLVLNEFLARPGHDWNNDGVVNVYDEFIEVANAGIVDVNLNQYKLDDYELDANGQVIQNGYTMPSQVLKPGEIAVFYGSQTGINLRDNGDTVRLLKSNNSVADARAYSAVKSLDVSTCRITDGYGDWVSQCFPTPGQKNSLVGEFYPPETGGGSTRLCTVPDSAPREFFQAECQDSGLDVWNPAYWNSFPGEGSELWLPAWLEKWLVIFQ